MKMTRTKTACILIVLFLYMVFVLPSFALGAEVGFKYIISQLQALVTFLLLPLAILMTAWRIIYLAVVCGMMGMDPLNMVSDMDQDNQISGGEVKEAIKAHLTGFVTGLMWVGGLFIIFQVALTVAAMLASTVAENF